MAQSGVLQGNKNWDKIFQLKLKHLDSLINVSQKIFYSVLVFFSVFLITILNIIISYNMGNVGVAIFGLALVMSILSIWFFSGMLQDKINSYYNKLFYELLIGEMKNIRGISIKEYKRLTKSLG